MKLYYMPGACSIGIHVLLEEIGKPYDLQKIDGAKQEQYGPDFVKINPKSKVPTLQRDDGSVLTEFPAIATWLARKNPEKGLLPSDPDGEARALEAMDYAVSTMHMQGFSRMFRPVNYAPTEADHDERQAAAIDEPDDRETIELGHLQVEESDVRPLGFDQTNGLSAVLCLADDLDVRSLFQGIPQERTGRSFVVCDDHAQTIDDHDMTPPDRCGSECATSSSGSTTRASAPSAPDRSAIDARPPYASARRRSMLASAMPLPSSETGMRSALRGVSSTSSCNAGSPVASAIRRATMRTRPPAAAGETPCLTAFSTSGWRMSGGTSTRSRSSGTSMSTSRRSSKRACSMSR